MTTAQPLDFDWRHAVADDNGELLPADTMNRGAHAQFLTQFLVAKGTEQNYILNLNSGWGGGKSWFIKRWKKTIESRYPAIYVDAWKNDHSKDPFLCVVSEIKTSLIDKTEMKGLASPGMEKALNIFKAAAPALIKGILKKHGADIEVIAEAIDSEALAEGGAKLVEDLIKNHEQTTASIEAFKLSISEWLRVAIEQSEGKADYPLFIFIDELDRCRPTFAIEMLETVKHIFDMTKVVFVIATDKEQLQHSIRAVYGAGFDSARYLDRFFHRSVVLQHDSVNHQIEAMVTASAVFNPVQQEFKRHILSISKDKNLIANWFTTIADIFRMNLRTVNLWFDRVEAIVAANKKIDVIFIAYLMAIYSCKPDEYKIYSEGVMKISDIKLFDIAQLSTKVKLSYTLNDCTDGMIKSLDKHYDREEINYVTLTFQTYVNLIDELSRANFNETSLKEKSLRNLMAQIQDTDFDGYDYEKNDNNETQPLLRSLLTFNMINYRHNHTFYKNLCELATTLK